MNSKTADFLEVRLDDRLGWNGQLKTLGALFRGFLVLHRIRRNCVPQNINYVSLPLSKLVYFKLIEQHILYYIILWGATKDNLDRIF